MRKIFAGVLALLFMAALVVSAKVATTTPEILAAMAAAVFCGIVGVCLNCKVFGETATSFAIVVLVIIVLGGKV